MKCILEVFKFYKVRRSESFLNFSYGLLMFCKLLVFVCKLVYEYKIWKLELEFMIMGFGLLFDFFEECCFLFRI